jgi:uncharacterized damage-inducible protein DinB
VENKSTFASEILKELETEATATRKCLEVIPAELFDWKPHERSMIMGYLASLVAEIPKWITAMVETSEIDIATFSHFEAKTTSDIVNYFDENLASAKNALQNASDETFDEPFHLKNQGKIVFTAPKKDHISSTVNHLVHHRGQLTVFMRLRDIPVPSIYGPSADDRGGF